MSFESELRAQLNKSEMHRHELMERLQDRVAEIAALQSERDALRTAVELVNKEILSRIDEEKCPRCGQQKKLLFTSASGEPARKP